MFSRRGAEAQKGMGWLVFLEIPMREVTLPKGHWPYLLYRAVKPTRRKPSQPQQRIIDQMRPGVWYESELGKESIKSCRALVNAGWCEMACVARKDKDGQLRLAVPEDILLDVVLGLSKKQPFEMYRIANK